MSRIRGRDTKPEFSLRSMLHRMGYRFTVNGPKNKRLQGSPDLSLRAEEHPCPHVAGGEAAALIGPHSVAEMIPHTLKVAEEEKTYRISP